MSKRLILLVGGLLFGSIMAGVFYFSGAAKNVTNQTSAAIILKAGSPLPDFKLVSLNNSEVDLNQYLGKPIIINFWATWCVPCKQEMPLFERYYQNQNGQLIILGIDNEEPADIIRPFVIENQISYPILLDNQGKIRDQFMIRGFPTSLFIDAKGIYKAEHIGLLDDESLKSYLQLIGVKI